jgi:hypothetical protein
MDTPRPVMTITDLVQQWRTDGRFDRDLCSLHAPSKGGCNVCRFADPFSDRLCTLPDISAEDFDLGVSGHNCSRFAPYEPG